MREPGDLLALNATLVIVISCDNDERGVEKKRYVRNVCSEDGVFTYESKYTTFRRPWEKVD